MLFFLAALPILILLLLMLLFRWSGPAAGLAGWLVAIFAAALAFGLTPQVFWVSQVKGLLLSLFVLAIFWPALYLYNVVQQAGGIRAMAAGLEQAVGDPGILTVILAWAFSGLLEGLAGFGLPIAVVAPMLAGLGVEPVTAVAAVAIGHAWSVTFGDMGVIFQTLLGVVHMDAAQLVPLSALLLGAACLACGLAAAYLLGQIRRWPLVVALGLLMAGVQYGLAAGGLTQLAAFGAGLSGVCGAVVYGFVRRRTVLPSPGRPEIAGSGPGWSRGRVPARDGLGGLELRRLDRGHDRPGPARTHPQLPVSLRLAALLPGGRHPPGPRHPGRRGAGLPRLRPPGHCYPGRRGRERVAVLQAGFQPGRKLAVGRPGDLAFSRPGQPGDHRHRRAVHADGA